MQVLLRLPAAPWLLGLMAGSGLAIFVFATSVLMLPVSGAVGDRLPELTCLQVAFTPARFTQVFLSFPPQGREAIAALLIPGDIVFAWGYGFLLAGLTGLVAMRLPSGWLRIGAVIMWAPLLASVMDCIEDIFLYTMAVDLLAEPATSIAPALPLLAGVAAVVKYTALSVVTPLYGLAAIYRGVRLDRSIGAITLYVLYGVLLLSMVVRPLQQIPPCI